ncbi:MAG: helix-hairpin-helix domain-containing protein [Pseudomonadota bacterium]
MNTFVKTLSLILITLSSTLAVAGPVDINSADATTLTKELVGVGAAKAKAIVVYREQHGAFTKPADILKVKGIGVRILEDNRHNIRIDSKSAKKKVVSKKRAEQK